MDITQPSVEESSHPASVVPCFLRGFFENPLQVASFVPSSGYLLRKLSAVPCLPAARTVVELGPGTGETTSALLNVLPANARLLCIEVVSEFVNQLRQISDARLLVEEGSALNLEGLLKSNHLSAPDVIVSGVPFSVMTRAEGQALMESIHRVLAPGGTFMTYQFRNSVCELAAASFGTPLQRSFVLWNFPPLEIFVWEKTA
tara:strand:+ start:2276 stop:2881 length:606 start_codon:yes stop_codon:yes gene_type:complete